MSKSIIKELEELGCISGSCFIRPKMGGQTVNGPCMCLYKIKDTKTLLRIKKALYYWQQRYYDHPGIEWIPVEYRMPETFKEDHNGGCCSSPVLALINCHDKIYIMQSVYYSGDNSSWFTDELDHIQQLFEVTHWAEIKHNKAEE